MARTPAPPTEPAAIDPQAIERAYARGALKSRRMEEALDRIARQMERDPESLARVLRRWVNEG